MDKKSRPKKRREGGNIKRVRKVVGKAVGLARKENTFERFQARPVR